MYFPLTEEYYNCVLIQDGCLTKTTGVPYNDMHFANSCFEMMEGNLFSYMVICKIQLPFSDKIHGLECKVVRHAT